MSIIILGGSGFLGKSLVQKLKEKYQVKVMIHDDDVGSNVEKFKGDILTPRILDREISSKDTIVNLIGQYDGNFSNFIDLNLIGGLNLLNSCIKKKINRVILISTIKVYGENMESPSKESDPLLTQTTYGMVKLLTEKVYAYYSKVYGLNITVLRLSNLYGPHKKSGYFSNLIRSIQEKKPTIAYNKGRQLRDLLFVEDASDGIIQAIKNPQEGFTVFNISSGKLYMINDLIKIIERISHKKLNIKLNLKIPDERCVWADNSKAKKILKFIPHTNIEEGLKITINDFMKSKLAS